MNKLTILFVMAVGAFGCGSQTPASNSTASNSAGAKPAETAAVAPPTFPDSLKNDAYDYEGLANPTDHTFVYKTGQTGGPPVTGVESFKFESLDGNKAKYSYTQKGGMQGDQQAEMSLEADGLYTESYSPQKLNTPHIIELPGKLPIGGSWKDHMSINANGSDFVLDSEYKVIGFRDVKTPAGAYKALYITGVGKGKMSGKPATVKTESWFAKGVGVVKQQLEIDTGNKVQTVTKLLQK